MKLKPILWTLLVVALVAFPLLGLRSRVAMLAESAAWSSSDGYSDPSDSLATDTALPSDGTAPAASNEAAAPSDGRSNDNVPLRTERPVVLIPEAELHLTGTYRLRNQDTPRIAEELKKRFPLLAISHDTKTETVVIREMPPKISEAVTKVIQELVAAQPEKPIVNPVNEKSDDNVPATTGLPIRPIRKAEVRVKDVPTQVQIKKAEVVWTESYSLKNQDVARIAEELKKIVPELEIVLDLETESINVLQMTPKQREFVTEVIQRLVAAARVKFTAVTDAPASSSGIRGPLPPPSTGSMGPRPIAWGESGFPNRNRATLKADVRRAFEARQASARKELAEFRSRIDRLSQTLEDRERQQETIIERRVDELLNPNLRWDATGNTFGGTEPSTNRSSTKAIGTATSAGPPSMPGSTIGPQRPRSDSSLPVPGSGFPGPAPSFGAPRSDSSLNPSPATNATATQALVRAAEARRKLAAYEVEQAAATLKLIEDRYKTGIVSETEVLRCRVDVERAKANFEIAQAELDAAKTGVDIRRPDKPSVTVDSAAKPGDPIAAGRVKPVTKSFRLQHTTIEKAEEALRVLTSENALAAKYATEAKNNTLTVIASPDDMPVIEAVIQRLDAATESSSPQATPKSSDDLPATPGASNTTNR